VCAGGSVIGLGNLYKTAAGGTFNEIAARYVEGLDIVLAGGAFEIYGGAGFGDIEQAFALRAGPVFVGVLFANVELLAAIFAADFEHKSYSIDKCAFLQR